MSCVVGTAASLTMYILCTDACFVPWVLLLHVHCCMFCVMGTAASYTVCCVLLLVCAMDSTTSYFVCCVLLHILC